ncbi:nucleotide sugar dehydrogenase [Bacillus mangrovi]|uniref:UDP-glucose 6-dehydrogenase n=1 Tax=Metabacillus mangrovi TaxID=1491830 RepID=A0A7X2S7R7_9BACI|nr:nucleotide sugar dehydrogenase [Metabacillus mangrovi]
MKRLAVVGTGYVGLVSGTCFAEIGNQVTCCDIDQSKIDLLNKGEIPIYEPGLKELVAKNSEAGRLSFTTDIGTAIQDAEVVYIAVGTPMSETGEADLKYVRAVAQTIGENLNGYKVIVNKSTVPVGTGKMVEEIVRSASNGAYEFDIVSNPEFLREGSAIKDTMQMERAVIGATSEKAAGIIEELHSPFQTAIVKTNLESAEMLKYAANAFLATKISFINDIANICELVGADVTKVAEGMGLDSRIGPKFLNAGVGFGGSCFPKDTTALLHIAESAGYDFELIKAVIKTNIRQRETVVHKLKNIFGDLNGLNVSVLGLAFKPNTDDMRYAPSVDIIHAITEEGASVKAYDPVAIEEAKKQITAPISYYTDVYETIQNTDVCIILTEWPEVLSLDLNKAKELMNKAILIDGRNIFSLTDVKEKGFIYHSVGRPQIQ